MARHSPGLREHLYPVPAPAGRKPAAGVCGHVLLGMGGPKMGGLLGVPAEGPSPGQNFLRGLQSWAVSHL